MQFGGEWGAYRDALSTALWIRARVMDPRVGRFQSADPAGMFVNSVHLYPYAGNDPIGRVDPSGLQLAPNFDDLLASLLGRLSDELGIGTALCNALCVGLAAVQPETINICLEACHGAKDVEELRRTLRRKLQLRGDCLHPKKAGDCFTSCLKQGVGSRSSCVSCCDGSVGDPDDAASCALACEHWAEESAKKKKTCTDEA